MSDVVLGLDSGGTKTRILWADPQGRLLAVAEGASLDPVTMPDWETRLAAMLAGRPRPSVSVLGLPRHGEVSGISASQIAVAERLLGPSAHVRNDVEVAFIGALGGQDGLLILSGTGSMAWARGPGGELRVGGWGDIFGDEGSAWWIGREALSLAARMLDGRVKATAFAAGLLSRIGTTEAELNAWVYGPGGTRSGMAAISRHVADLAAEGDAAAASVLKAAAAELALHCHAGANRAGLGAGYRWSYAGGVFRSAVLRAELARLVGTEPTPPVLPPEGGAVLEAARLAGWAPGNSFVRALQSSIAGSGGSEDPP
jgi:glucosamine kinase